MRELSRSVYSLSVKSPWWTQFLRLVSSLNLFAPSTISKIIITAESCALAFSIFALDRLIIFASLLHSDRRDCRRSAFSNSSTYLLRTLSCLAVAFFAAPHGLFICFTLPIIFFLGSTSNLDAHWCFDRIASSPCCGVWLSELSSNRPLPRRQTSIRFLLHSENICQNNKS